MFAYIHYPLIYLLRYFILLHFTLTLITKKTGMAKASQHERTHISFCTNSRGMEWSGLEGRATGLPISEPHQPVATLHIYAIWTERNSRLHRSVFRSTDSITKNIITQVTNRISSFRPSNPAISSKLMQIWFSTE